MKTKICNPQKGGCGKEFKLNYDNFYYVNKEKGWFHTLCKICHNKHSCTWMKKNKDRVNIRKKQQYQNNPVQKNWATDSIAGHRRSGYAVTITIKELYELAFKADKCFYCGCSLDWSRNKKKMNKFSPSLENIDLNNILTLNNVCIICLSCNVTKGHKTFKEFVEYCKYISNKFNPKIIAKAS